MNKAATLIVLAMAVPLLMAAQCGGSSSAGTGPSASPTPAVGGSRLVGSQRVPARAPGHCAVTTTVVHDEITRKIDGLLVMSCSGAAALHILALKLEWQDRLGAWDTEAELRQLDNLENTGSFHTVSAPCRTGNWKELVLGLEVGVGAAQNVRLESDVVHVAAC